ncbi:MAG: hypothetical protein ACK50Y_06060 [Flavobacteriia bacterium]
MAENKLHIVCLDVPFPADYGGAIDMFYRIKALHDLGFELTIHAFEYGRGKQKELEKYGRVHYYKRRKSIFHLFSSRPFIVQSRKNRFLLNRLLEDSHPILFEGHHTTYYLENENIQKRLTFVRLHNIEHEYYGGLKKQTGFLKQLFFQLEEQKLKKYQSILKLATYLLAIKQEDANKMADFHSHVKVLAASIPDIDGSFTKVKRYALFHGNLSVPENNKAAMWIIHTLKSVLDVSFPLIIAGKNPGKQLVHICKKEGIQLVSNPSEKQLKQLIQEAQTHVLYTAVSSGIKLKLLACLHSSGHLLANKEMIEGTAVAEFCVVADDPKDFKMHFIGLKNTVLTEEDFSNRSKFILQHFNNQENCLLIKQLIDSHEA